MVETYGAFFEMYRSFSPYDDEGYIMLTVKQFLLGHRLYSEIFTQYGPFYYLYNSFLHSVTGLPVTHDSTRLLALCTWVAIPLICAFAIYQVTRSIVVAAIVQLLVFGVLRASTAEPGHPVGLGGLLLAIGMLLCGCVGTDDVPTWAVAGLGVIFAALTLTKINLGAFWGISIGVAMLLYGRKSAVQCVLTIVAIVVGVLLPFAVMRAYLGQPPISDLATIVALSFFACVTTAYGQPPELFGWKKYGIVIGSAIAALAGILLYIFFHGTSPQMVLKGVLLDPWHWVGTFVLISPVLHAGAVFAAVGAGIATICAVRRDWIADRARWARWVVASLKGAFGIGVLACGLKYFTRAQFPSHLLVSYGTPFVFLAVMPAFRERKSGLAFYRFAWCLIAVFQTLQSYPVAGTDAIFSIFPTFVVAGICLRDAWQALAPVLQSLPHYHLTARVAEAVAVVAIASFCFSSGASARAEYFANEPLNLPGAQKIRLRHEIAERFRRLTSDIEQNSDIFVAVPGMDSFYFWTRQEPPTSKNLGFWMTALPAQDQARIVAVLERHPRASVIYSPEIVRFWTHSLQAKQGPLVDYIFSHFQTVESFQRDTGYWQDSYQLMVRKEEVGRFSSASTKAPASAASDDGQSLFR